jgi:hypothetical protein
MRSPVFAFAFAFAAVGCALVAPRVAYAGEFDERGIYLPDADAVAFETFDVSPVHYVPEGTEPECLLEHYELVSDQADALDGDSFLRVQTTDQCPERLPLVVPMVKGSYAVKLWMRHGSADARLAVAYPPALAIPGVVARLAPTGRATSDGWIELESNAIPVDGTQSPTVYVRFSDFGSEDGVDLDAIEITAQGEYRDQPACSGVGDPICGEDAICYGGQCRLGALSVPPLPNDAIRDEMVDAIEMKLNIFFGGRKTRLSDMPVALDTLTSIRSAPTAWQFWNGFARAIRELHDWHTHADGPIGESPVAGRLNVCFIEGDADLTHGTAPADATYKDILVSHVGGSDTAGLNAGDRLVAVDGMHPIAWAREQIAIDWGYHVACDDTSFADFAEDLGGPLWMGGATILKYAKTFSVIRCDATGNTCASEIEVIDVAGLPSDGGGYDVACDNRPTYHLEGDPADIPDPQNHYVFGSFFRGPIAGTTPAEAIHGMVFDTLYGGGDANGSVNSAIRNAVTEWKASARGVIIDHRAGNGGTIDAPEYMTQLVRPPATVAAMLAPIDVARWDGPESPAQGIAAFNRGKAQQGYNVGSVDHDPNLPVALVLHRDGSASDFLPQGMKGAPKVRLFGPGPSAGGFSTFIQFVYWGGISFQFASGDTLTSEGAPLIGHGVVPDEVVQQKQSDLLAGVDTIHEAALAWVRSELKP